MWRVVIYLGLVLAGLIESLRLHVPFFNDNGSTNPDEPYKLEQPEMSKAVYGRLGEGDDVAHFSFTAPVGHSPALILLIPAPSYTNYGLRASMRVFGPGLPAEGITSELTEHFMKIVGHEYVMVQSYTDSVQVAGEFHVTVERIAGKGTYCFCLGTGETRKIPRELFTRVDEIINRDELAKI
jgi:hypothetical protein